MVSIERLRHDARFGSTPVPGSRDVSDIGHDVNRPLLSPEHGLWKGPRRHCVRYGSGTAINNRSVESPLASREQRCRRRLFWPSPTAWRRAEPCPIRAFRPPAFL